MENDDIQSPKVRSLTQEQIDWLKTCPYVQSFSGKRIFWTSNVLERFSEEYDKGEQATKILERLGIDLQILGKNRVAMFRNYYSETWRPRHYNLPEGNNHAQYNKSSASMSKAEMKFNHRLRYLEQEVDFLKKISIANHKANTKQPSPQQNTA